jgi:predicted nuclease of predicted toxin-antitoxin system
MKLPRDQGTARSAATILRRAGLDAVHTGETGLAEGEDSEILGRASDESRIVVTVDAIAPRSSAC